jgi:hypothetical protein
MYTRRQSKFYEIECILITSKCSKYLGSQKYLHYMIQIPCGKLKSQKDDSKNTNSDNIYSLKINE